MSFRKPIEVQGQKAKVNVHRMFSIFAIIHIVHINLAMSESRLCYWRHPTIANGEFTAISTALEPTFSTLMRSPVGFSYPSKELSNKTDYNSSKCIEILVKHKEPLAALIELDPRGGHFKQQDIHAVSPPENASHALNKKIKTQ